MRTGAPRNAPQFSCPAQAAPVAARQPATRQVRSLFGVTHHFDLAAQRHGQLGAQSRARCAGRAVHAGDRACALVRVVRGHHRAGAALDLLFAVDGRRADRCRRRAPAGRMARRALCAGGAGADPRSVSVDQLYGHHPIGRDCGPHRHGAVHHRHRRRADRVALCDRLGDGRAWCRSAALCVFRCVDPRHLRPCGLFAGPGHVEPVFAHRGPVRSADGRRGAIYLAVFLPWDASAENRTGAGLRRSGPCADRSGAGRSGSDGGNFLDHVLLDQRVCRGGRRDHRHLHHSADEAHGLPAQGRRRDRGCRLVRRADHAAGDGRRRLPHGRADPDALCRHRRRRADPGVALRLCAAGRGARGGR